jgi:hypothetical protein
MLEENDWRLTNQEKHLLGRTLVWRRYVPPRPSWDHDHCEFCWATFMDNEYADYREGYTTEDNYYWICPVCFEDFKDMFGWTVRKE